VAGPARLRQLPVSNLGGGWRWGWRCDDLHLLESIRARDSSRYALFLLLKTSSLKRRVSSMFFSLDGISLIPSFLSVAVRDLVHQC
jgi:hypothetical protein